MVSPVRMPRSERRAQLLLVAVACFTRDGYYRTSMEMVATAAGVTKPVLYQHFSSKEELYLEVIRRVGSQMCDQIDQLLDMEGDTSVRVAFALERISEIIIASAEPLRILDTSDAASPIIESAVRDIYDHCARGVGTVLMHSRELTEADAELLGQGLTGMVRATAGRLAAAGTSGEQEHLVSLLGTFISSGLRAFPSIGVTNSAPATRLA